MDLSELELDVRMGVAALDEARAVYERTNIEVREIKTIRMAEYTLRQAELRLAEAMKEAARVTAREEAELQRQKRREPPSLQALVLAHSTWDRTTSEAWAKFDADMAEWKAKIRKGEFDAKIW